MKMHGFTLIELLVVIAIIGLLATFAVVQMANTGPKARDAKRKADLRAMQKALELYYANNESYPSSGGVWRFASSYGLTGTNGYIPSLAPTYIGILATDPKPMPHPELSAVTCADASATQYVYNSNGTGYKLISRCSMETGFLSPSDPFYDPNRVYAMMVCSQSSPVACTW